MAAKVTKQFPGVPDGETQVRDIKVGEIIHGELARVALEQKWAEETGGTASKKSGAVDLEAMNVDALKEHAEANSIDLGGAKKKDDIIAAIRKAQKAA